MNKVLILLGPTGVGKTSVSILLAKALNTEIISADSMQIYRYMDIGTAKPTPGEMSTIKHHMIDVVDPWESYSTGRYIAIAATIIDGLLRKGKIPIVVGGTGLYIKAMTRGIFSGPSADWSLREELLSLEKEEKGSLYNYLKELDPVTAEKITANDTRRIIRALEVCLKSKMPLSEIQEKLTAPLPYEFIKIGLSRDRKELYRIIEKRVDKMITDGLVDEVKKITEMIRTAEAQGYGDRSLNSPLPSTQAIGYKEIARYLHPAPQETTGVNPALVCKDGVKPWCGIYGDITLDETIGLIKKGTKRYAKRQFTWFKKEEGIHWVDITGIDDIYEAFMRVNHVLRHLL